ncbi:MAG: DUF4922 domain-containing protein [Prevotellaceae bacterium]|nr:DUF4922 domain-containing protein [Prevotellaceae bacterium]
MKTAARWTELFDRQMAVWDDARRRFDALSEVVVRSGEVDDCPLMLQHNPTRIVSTGAKTDARSIGQRPCFLCRANRPEVQEALPLPPYELLVNPFPILPQHFTIPLATHEPQRIAGRYADMMRMAADACGLLLFYNGPECGASAPDHLHFQAGSRGVVPVERDWSTSHSQMLERLHADDERDGGIFAVRSYLCPALAIVASSPERHAVLFEHLYRLLPQGEGQPEPRMNVVAWRDEREDADTLVSIVFPRAKHRPQCYGEDGLMVSPGALDMGGLMVVPREADFHWLTLDDAAAILREVALSAEDFEELKNRLKHINHSS